MTNIEGYVYRCVGRHGWGGMGWVCGVRWGGWQGYPRSVMTSSASIDGAIYIYLFKKFFFLNGIVFLKPVVLRVVFDAEDDGSVRFLI